MSTEENKAVLRRFYDKVFTQGNTDVIEEFVAADAVEHEEFPGITGQGPGVVRQFVTAFRTAFPDLEFEIHDLIAEHDKVVARLTIHGTHEGELMGIPPTGKRVAVSAIDIVRLADGKMVEHWGSTDTLGMMQQLGVIPTVQ